MKAGEKKAPDRRVVLVDAAGFGPEQIVALSKLCDAKSKDVVAARGKLKTQVYPVDVTVRIVGDIEVGVTERTPDKFETAKYLVAALAHLTPAVRKKILSKNPGGPKAAKIMAAAEVEAFKSKLPKHDAPGKLTPHLTVTRMDADGNPAHVLLGAAARTAGVVT